MEKRIQKVLALQVIKIPLLISISEDLELKAVGLDDIDAFLEIILENKKYFSQFDFNAPLISSRQEVVTEIKSLIEYRKNLNGAHYGLWLRGTLIGFFTLNHIDWNNRYADLGYWLVEKASGHGYATAGLNTIVGLCFDTFNLSSVSAHTAITNVQSQRLLERTGFVQVKIVPRHIHVRGQKFDAFLYLRKAKD